MNGATLTRRHLLKPGVAAGARLLLPRRPWSGKAFAAIPGGSLDPGAITKYAMPPPVPPAMPGSRGSDLPGLYVWHCHIVEHEDNEMMRPYLVGPHGRRGRGRPR